MKSTVNLIRRHKKVILLGAVLLVLGAVSGWEAQELKDAETGRVITRHRRVVFLWQESSLEGTEGQRVDFRVRRWFLFGLYTVDVTGRMTYGTEP